MKETKELTIEELQYVQSELKLKGRNTSTGYVLTLLAWPLGINRAYFGKLKSAKMRIGLTGLTLFVFSRILKAANSITTEEAMKEAINSSTALMVAFITLSTISLIFFLLELLSVQNWVEERNSEIEKEAAQSAIKARHAKNKLKKFEKKYQANLERERILAEERERVLNEENKKKERLKLPTIENDIVFVNDEDKKSFSSQVFTQIEDLNTIVPNAIDEESLEVQSLPEDLEGLVDNVGAFPDDEDFVPVNPLYKPIVKLTLDEHDEFTRQQRAVESLQSGEKLNENNELAEDFSELNDELDSITAEELDDIITEEEDPLYRELEKTRISQDLFEYKGKKKINDKEQLDKEIEKRKKEKRRRAKSRKSKKRRKK